MDKKKTLLHVLTKWAKQNDRDLLRLDEDLAHVNEASQWSLTDLKQQVGYEADSHVLTGQGRDLRIAY